MRRFSEVQRVSQPLRFDFDSDRKSIENDIPKAQDEFFKELKLFCDKDSFFAWKSLLNEQDSKFDSLDIKETVIILYLKYIDDNFKGNEIKIRAFKTYEVFLKILENHNVTSMQIIELPTEKEFEFIYSKSNEKKANLASLFHPFSMGHALSIKV